MPICVAIVTFLLQFDMTWFLQISNIIFVDQPTGTGFSYSSDDRDTRHDETGVSNDLYDFLQVLLLCWFSIADVLSFFCCTSSCDVL